MTKVLVQRGVAAITRKFVCFTNRALVLIVGLEMSVDAHVGDRVYPFNKLTEEMVAEIQLHDGSVEEWYELIGEPTLTLLDFASMKHGESRDPSDMDFRIWLAWHDDPARIYVAFASADNEYNSEFGDPAIQFAIDADHGGGTGCPCEDPVEALGQTQLYLAVARTSWGGGRPWMTHISGSRRDSSPGMPCHPTVRAEATQAEKTRSSA